MDENPSGRPVLSLVLGILGLIFWIIPIFELLVTIPGLIFGVNAVKRQSKGVAVAAVIICSLGLGATGINMIWGAYLGATGQHKLVNRILHK